MELSRTALTEQDSASLTFLFAKSHNNENFFSITFGKTHVMISWLCKLLIRQFKTAHLKADKRL